MLSRGYGVPPATAFVCQIKPALALMLLTWRSVTGVREGVHS